LIRIYSIHVVERPLNSYIRQFGLSYSSLLKNKKIIYDIKRLEVEIKCAFEFDGKNECLLLLRLSIRVSIVEI
jgi:hypothetical protein